MRATGVDADGDRVKIAIIKKSFKKISIKSLKEIGSDDVKQLYKRTKGKVISGLKASEVLIHHFPMSLKKKSLRKKALSFQIDSLNYLEQAKRVDIPIFFQKMGLVTCYTTIKSYLDAHIKKWKKLSIDPEYVSFMPAALCRFITYCLGLEEKVFLLHIGYETSTCVLMDKKNARYTCSIPFGEKHFIERLEKGRKKKKRDVSSEMLCSCLDEFIAEVEKALYFFKDKSPFEKIAFLCTGELKLFTDLESILLEQIDGFCKSYTIDKELSSYAVPIGYALDGLLEDGVSLQFRQKEFVPSKQLKKIGRKALYLPALSIGLSLMLYLFGSQNLEKSRKDLDGRLDHAYLKERAFFSKKQPLSGSVEDKLDLWKKTLKKEAKDFPYLYPYLRVTDLLSWMDSEQILGSIKINSISYEVKSFPKIGNAKAPYKIFVEWNFTAISSIDAKKLHKYLESECEFINSKENVTLHEYEDSYKISFYLRNTV